jgi:heptosyltransferase III
MAQHTYLTTIRWKRILQHFTDVVVDAYASIFIQKDKGKILLSPKSKFLFISLGHLGDALILSYVFPLVKKHYPCATIDVLTSSGCLPVLMKNPFIRKIHTFDHYRNNRASIPWWKKIFVHSVTLRQALREIHIEDYDVSIEGRVHYPNGNLLALRGKIEHRIGFGSGGYGGLLTIEVALAEVGSYHLLQAILTELEYVGILGSLEDIQPYLPVAQNDNNVSQKLLRNDAYVLLNPESGAETRMLSTAFLQQVLLTLINESSWSVVICGVSSDTAERVNAFIQANSTIASRIINLVGKLSVDEFFRYAQHAIISVTVESFAAHLCAIACPTFSIFKNGSGALYFPFAKYRSVVVHHDKVSIGHSVFSHTESHYVESIESEETLNVLSNFILNYKVKN